MQHYRARKRSHAAKGVALGGAPKLTQFAGLCMSNTHIKCGPGTDPT